MHIYIGKFVEEYKDDGSHDKGVCYFVHNFKNYFLDGKVIYSRGNEGIRDKIVNAFINRKNECNKKSFKGILKLLFNTIRV